MKFRWSLAAPQPLLVNQLATPLALPPLLAQCLVNRGHTSVESAAAFLAPRLKNLADPFLLPNMRAAVERLFGARASDEPLVIFGDYDVDGVCSTALLTEVLGALGWKVHQYLPHRMAEGYGLTRDGVEKCLQKFPVKLLLAVDCGSTAVETIAWLRERGVDVIVLDHHQVSSPAPAAVALVNPQLSTLNSQPSTSFTELCSAGLAFKLAHALLKHGRATGLAGADAFDLKPLLDLVALATVADLVPLVGENRILVHAGLLRLTSTTRPGLVALKEVAAVKGDVGVYEVGFQLGPRLNAAGRLETAEESLDLVLARSLEDALPIAHSLDARNRERQDIERGIADNLTARLRQSFDPARDFAIVEGEMMWHVGVVGIVASRVLREFYRPTIVLGGDGHEWRGSGRSIEGFDLAAGLRACDDLLLRHGGHAMAAGLSIHPKNVDALRTRLNELVQRSLSPDQLRPVLRLDAELSARDLTLGLLDELEQLNPFGQGNPPLQFLMRGLRLARPPQRMGREQQHAKLFVTGDGVTHEVVWWRCGDSKMPEGNFDLAFAPERNEYNGRVSLQLKLLDWRAGK
ncbi:MAG: single-stranded-DNA-specific exonuclease RecJ [Verrucomicrobia bacterium]|nr:single-stranded-DNA-specific exonuclease RecJ [Verrucomicrobiota bacterium]